MHKYDKKLNIKKLRQCEACLKVGWGRVQHHVYGRRYDDRCIWVCVKCHAEIHANPAWAYKYNLLFKKDLTLKKEKKTKVCTHSKSYFDSKLGYIKCNFCGKQIAELKFGSKKKKESTMKNKTVKMGAEKQDPRIKQIEVLKRELIGITLKLKKTRDLTKQSFLKNRSKEIHKSLKTIEQSYE